MFEDIYEDNEKVYKFELNKLDLDDEKKLYLELQGFKTIEDLIELDSKQFKDKFNVFSKDILKALKKFGYRLTGDTWERNHKILLNSQMRSYGII